MGLKTTMTSILTSALLSSGLYFYILTLILTQVQGICPPRSQVTASLAAGGTQFGGRTLNQACCGTSGRRQCQCNFGLECCRNNIDQRICIESPCGTCNNGRCVTRNGGPTCVCNQGFVLNRASNCVRRGNRNNARQPRSRGVSGLLDSFLPSRRGTGGSVLDIFQCINNPCGPGVCSVVRGRVDCDCNPGFVFSRVTNRCEDPDQFTTNPPTTTPAAAPTTTASAPRIPVIDLSGSAASGSTDSRCSAPNVCAANSVCSIESDTVVCSCQIGFELSAQGTCFVDICKTNPCPPGEICTMNTEGNFHQCSCPSGLSRSQDNECVDARCASSCGPNTVCSIESGNVVCNCKSDTFLTASGRCFNATCDNSCSANQVCTTGNGFAVCSCKPGFTQSPTTGDCLDPCIPNPCGSHKNCVVDIRSRSTSCECPEGLLEGPGDTCTASPCEPNPCGIGGRCVMDGQSATCNCLPGFILHQNKCVGNPCVPNPCGIGGACTVKALIPTCNCSPGFELSDNTCIASTNTPAPSTEAESSQGARSSTVEPVAACGEDVDCGSGTCSIIAGQSVCVCPEDLIFTGVTCTEPVPCDPASTPSTLEIGDSGTRKILIGTTTGCLKSRNYPAAPYSANIFDEVVLPVQGHTTLHLVIEHLETQTAVDNPLLRVNTCRNDFLFVKGQLFCGFITPEDKPALRMINVAGLETITMGFVSNAQNEFAGFLMRWVLV